MTPKTYFEELSYALRRRELLPRSLEEDGLLPVEWNGRILCRVTESGVVGMTPPGGHQQGKRPPWPRPRRRRGR